MNNETETSAFHLSKHTKSLRNFLKLVTQTTSKLSSDCALVSMLNGRCDVYT